jgi:phage-related protein (TIGR01555 family)
VIFKKIKSMFFDAMPLQSIMAPPVAGVTQNLNAHYYVERYRDSGLTKRFINLMANDATSSGRTFKCVCGGDIDDAIKNHCINQMFNKLLVNARISGAAAIVVVVEGQRMDMPLNLNSINKNSRIRYLVKTYGAGITAGQYGFNTIDPLAENYLMPDFYQVGTTQVHHSRVILIQGEELPQTDNDHLAMIQGDSSLRCVDKHIKEVEESWKNLHTLVDKANLDYFQISDLNQVIGTEDGRQMLRNRIADLKNSATVSNIGAIDANDNIVRSSVAMTGFSEAVAKLERVVSSVGGYPISIFWGDMQTGLSTEGSADKKAYAKEVKKVQESILRPAIVTFDQIFVRNMLGSMPSDYSWEFNPIEQMDPAQLIENEGKKVTTELQLLNARIIGKSNILERLQSESTYQITDDQIEAAKAEEAEAAQIDEELRAENA